MTTAALLLEDETDCPAVGIPLDRHVMPQPAVRAAYADPPYLGLAHAFYGKMHAEAAEYDKPETHQRLIERLSDEYDCWAMSLHEPALHTILSMCPRDVRVAAWVKPFASFKKKRYPRLDVGAGDIPVPPGAATADYRTHLARPCERPDCNAKGLPRREARCFLVLDFRGLEPAAR